jgi:hypothetical protein
LKFGVATAIGVVHLCVLRRMVARPNVGAGVVRTGGRGCQIPVARGARAIPCKASKPMCGVLGWMKWVGQE